LIFSRCDYYPYKGKPSGNYSSELLNAIPDMCGAGEHDAPEVIAVIPDITPAPELVLFALIILKGFWGCPELCR
jgi:hypothetical protein